LRGPKRGARWLKRWIIVGKKGDARRGVGSYETGKKIRRRALLVEKIGALIMGQSQRSEDDKGGEYIHLKVRRTEVQLSMKE